MAKKEACRDIQPIKLHCKLNTFRLQHKIKHGISFEEARDHIFEGRNLLATGVAYEKDEVRHAVIGKFKGKYYTGIFTIRIGTIRIISVRRSRREEEYEAKKQGL